MKLSYTYFFLILTLVEVSFTQIPDPENNWYKEIGRGNNPYSGFDFRRYTKDDVLRAKEKYNQLINSNSSEWEGTYSRNSMLGISELVWSAKIGFVSWYAYHSLVSLAYGRIERTDDVIKFRSEKPSTGKVESDPLVLVKLGDIHFLVPKDKLSSFAQRAVGLARNQDENDYVWVNVADRGKRAFGLPQFPKRFAHLVRRPILTSVRSIGKPRLRQDKFESGEVYAEYNDRLIKFNVGRTSRVKIGMVFFIDDWDEWVEITHVSNSQASGILSRSLSKSKNEVCWDDDGVRDKERPCRQLKIGSPARTLSSEFEF